MLQIDEHALYYDSIRVSRRVESVQVLIAGFEDNPFRIPLTWLASCGVNTYETVYTMLQSLVEQDGKLVDRDRNALDLLLPAEAIELFFLPLESKEFSWAKGPQASNRFRAPKEGEGWGGTSVTGSQVSDLQSKLHVQLLRRDGWCVISYGEEVDAAHLVPKQRQDLYQHILGEDFAFNVYDSSMGVLLERTLHHLYNRFKISFYTKDDDIYVHVFEFPLTPRFLPYHGLRIERSRFRLSPAAPSLHLPDKRLMNWHYRQCCMMRIRGFSAGMQIDAM